MRCRFLEGGAEMHAVDLPDDASAATLKSIAMPYVESSVGREFCAELSGRSWSLRSERLRFIDHIYDREIDIALGRQRA